jgi:hypothetical protein
MSCRRPANMPQAVPANTGAPMSQQESLDVRNLRAALDAHASTTAALSMQGHYELSDGGYASRVAKDDADVAALIGVLDMIHPEHHPDPEWSDDEISGWLSDLGGKLNRGLKDAQKLGKGGLKKFRDNTKYAGGDALHRHDIHPARP